MTPPAPETTPEITPEKATKTTISPLHEFILKLTLSDQEKGLFLRSELLAIEAYEDKKWLMMRLLMEGSAGPEAYQAFVDGLKGEIPETSRVVLDIHYPEKVVPVERYLELHQNDLFFCLAQSAGVTEAWLALCRYKTDNGELVFLFPNDLVKQELEAKRCPWFLGGLLKDRCGWEVPIRFEVDRELLPPPPPPTPAAEVPKEKPKEILPQTVLGRTIAEQPRPMNAVRNEEEKGLVVEGEIVDMREIVPRNGRRLLTLTVTDHTDSLEVKFFYDNNEGKYKGGLKPGHWIRARGDVFFDKYSRDYVMTARDVVRVAPVLPERMDPSPVKRVELHCHTQMSRMDAVIKIQRLLETAARWGHDSIAITDHGVVQAYPEARVLAKKNGLKLILGMEGYLVDHYHRDKDLPIYHMTLLVRDAQGLKNLYRMVSDSHLKYFYKKPLIPREVLQKHREGLLVGSACEQGEVWQGLFKMRKDPRAEAHLARLKELIAFYDYIEVMPCGNNEFMVREGLVEDVRELQALTRHLIETAREAGKTVAATGDAHFLEPRDELYRRIIQAGMGFKSERQAPLYFRTTEEMLGEFAYLGAETARELVVENTRKIADLISDVEPLPSKTLSPHWEGADELLRNTVREQAHRLYGDPLPAFIEKRLAKELDAIINHHYATLYVIAMKLVRRSLEDGYLVGSRGSVGSSLVAFLSGITEVNPLPPHWRCGEGHHHEFPEKPVSTAGVDLPDKDCPRCGRPMVRDGFSIAFEVFMGFEGNKMPDIDLNFSGEYQHRAHKHVEELFGKNQCFRAGTISSVKDRIAYGFVKKYLEESGRNVRNAEINRLVRGCSGVAKTTGQHPGGIVLLPKGLEIYDICPIQHPADREAKDARGADKEQANVITTHFDYDSMHECLVKLDILGHDNPTSLKHLEEMTGVGPVGIPLNDPGTMGLFSGIKSLKLKERIEGLDLGTLGVPEFGTGFAMGMLRDTKPTRFEDLVRLSGLAHGTDVWLGNAQDLIKSRTATLATVISTRDDMLNDLAARGMEEALAFRIMEAVRKGRGLEPDWEKAMKAAKTPSWYVDSCKKIKYIFPKAHAVAYCIMSFRIAYFKVHHPVAFYCDHFTNKASAFDAQVACGGLKPAREHLRSLRLLEKRTAKQDDEVSVLEVVEEFYARGLRMLPVDLYRSDGDRFRPEETPQGLMVRPPLIALSGLGESAARSILEERLKRPFSSVEDLVDRCGINKNVVEILKSHGCLTGVPDSEQITLLDMSKSPKKTPENGPFPK